MKYIGLRVPKEVLESISRIRRKALKSKKVQLTDSDILRGALMYGLPKLEKIWE